MLCHHDVNTLTTPRQIVGGAAGVWTVEAWAHVLHIAGNLTQGHTRGHMLGGHTIVAIVINHQPSTINHAALTAADDRRKELLSQ